MKGPLGRFFPFFFIFWLGWIGLEIWVIWAIFYFWKIALTNYVLVGELSLNVPGYVTVEQDLVNSVAKLSIENTEEKTQKAMWGT